MAKLGFSDIEQYISELEKRFEKQIDLLSVFLDCSEISQKDAMYYSGCSISTVKTLEKKGIITSEMHPSPLGPSRKYYSITPDGVEYLNEFKTNWKQISQSVNQVFDTEV